MEEEVKISFWKKLKTSIFGLEEYQKLAAQRLGKTVGYLAKLMFIFAFIVIVITCRFGTALNQAKQYVENEISDIYFENNILKVTPKGQMQESIVVEDEKTLNGKLIIDTQDLTQEQINSYIEDAKGYQNGIVILKDKIVFKTAMTAIPTTISLQDIATQYNIVKLDKQDILNMVSGNNIYVIYGVFLIIMCIYLLIIYLSTVLIDAILYSFLGYITGMFSKLRLKYSACYNIAVHALTLPIILNLVYMVINILTGYTIQYFDIMYMAVTSIYIITAVLMIKSDMIKKQIELSKIITEQEKVRQEMERRGKIKNPQRRREKKTTGKEK